MNIDGAISSGWPHSDSQRHNKLKIEPSAGPTFYSGTLQPNGVARDTFVLLSKWTKVGSDFFLHFCLYYWFLHHFLTMQQGQIWINGKNLGRYWPVRGPQQTLYVPGPLLSATSPNNITVLELESAPPRLTIMFMDRPQLSFPGGKS